mgnify:CR=1 FL=1
MHECFFKSVSDSCFCSGAANYDFSKLKREHFGRGVIAIRENPSTVAVSWRYLSSDRWTSLLMFIET